MSRVRKSRENNIKDRDVGDLKKKKGNENKKNVR